MKPLGSTSHPVTTPLSTDAEQTRWARVSGRDRSADGLFVYAVTTTGVFCRPSCPSRRPRRDRVRFFDDTTAAAAAGFRACLRCRPTETAGRGGSDPMRSVVAYLDAHVDQAVSLASLGRMIGMSPSRLQRRFKGEVGLSPREYQAARRAETFRRELREGADVTTAIYQAGYGSPSRVYETAPTGKGMSPTEYRRGGQGLEIGYAIVPSPLGRLLVAATAAGVCAVKLGDRDETLQADLEREFPQARLRRSGVVPDEWLTTMVSNIGASNPQALPLDVQGTAFQWRVWRALQQIPVGETRTYADVARSLGAPTASRAVARACATNPVALVVPCHRVVPKNGAGTVGGYRWGTERKRQLLELEASASRPVRSR